MKRVPQPDGVPRRPRGRPPRDATLPPGDPGVLTGPGAESFSRAILNSLPGHLCVIESDGRVVAVNKQWEKFAQEASDVLPDAPGLGDNYLDALAEGRVFERAHAEAAARGIQDVLDRQRVRYETEYPIELATGVQWFMSRPSRTSSVSHVDS